MRYRPTPVATVEKDLAELKSRPARIDVSGIPRDFRVVFQTPLKGRPNNASRSYYQLRPEQLVANLLETPDSQWALVATTGGEIGYVPSAALRSAPSESARPPQPVCPTGTKLLDGNCEIIGGSPGPAPKPKNSAAIRITSPGWDAGFAGQRISVESAGFLTLAGQVKSEKTVSVLQIGGKKIKISADGRFRHNIFVNRSMALEITAVLSDGRREKLSFELAVKSP